MTRQTPSSEHFLSLIVPAYKQEKIILDNLSELQAVLEQIRYDYEIIVVIDGMVDNTFQKIKEKKIPKVKLIAYQNNNGKSFAIRMGMSHAKGDYVMFIDSGMEIDPNGISMLMEHMEWYDADIIVGSKRHPASIIQYSALRKILSYGYYYFVRFIFGLNVRDTQAGIKIYKKKVLEKVLPRLVEKKFAGDLEILVVARSLGFHRIFEAPIKLNYYLGGVTSAANMKSIVGIFVDTLAIFYRSRILRFYSKSPKATPFPDKLHIYPTTRTTK